MKISIQSDLPDIAKQLRDISKDMGRKAVTSALNKTVSQGEKMMARQISREYRIDSETVRQRLGVEKVSSRKGNIVFEASLLTAQKRRRGLNLKRFLTGQTQPRGTQLKFQIKRGSVKKEIRGAFIGNKGRTVFIRTTEKRTPIRAVSTIEVPQMFNTKRINTVIARDI